eukprot:CAMPEP_0175022410 /NCGR_PEP_ID=MMETSP0005-20121125/15298_1 /TAXON_ID=420556 /ORGANISM="Ochromonas sp., Strain CCMP1393" /LENGTH=436 /DNA_ID=CAMNT_0016280653 /DNA_START=190 /DNA_END=1500 /DNA_ORIENTATION=-
MNFHSDNDAKVESLRSSNQMTQIGSHIHFNNAGDSPMPLPVLNTVKSVLDQEHIEGGYATADSYKDELLAVYDKIGKLIGADEPQVEIALVDSATTAWVKAFYSIPLKPGDVIVLSHVEYAANYVAALQQCKRYGSTIEVIAADPVSGTACLRDLARLLQQHRDRVKVVALTWIPTNGGVVSDAAAVGQLCKTYAPGAVYILDACQAVGQVVVDVRTLQCDVLTATGRKYLRGPRGTGFLYVRKQLLLPAVKQVQVQAQTQTEVDSPPQPPQQPPQQQQQQQQQRRRVRKASHTGPVTDTLITEAYQRLLLLRLLQHLGQLPENTWLDEGKHKISYSELIETILLLVKEALDHFPDNEPMMFDSQKSHTRTVEFLHKFHTQWGRPDTCLSLFDKILAIDHPRAAELVAYLRLRGGPTGALQKLPSPLPCIAEQQKS